MATRKTNTAPAAGERACAADASVRERARATREALNERASQPDQIDLRLISKTVEQKLLEANIAYEALLYTYDRAHNFLEACTDERDKKSYQLVITHSVRRMRVVWREALAMPATTIMTLGLQARIVATDVHDLWSQEDLSDGELGSIVLIDKLIALAGLSRIHRPDVTVHNLQNWIRDPETAPGRNRYDVAA